MKVNLSLQTATPQRTTLLCWMMTTSCHRHSHPWCCPLPLPEPVCEIQTPALFMTAQVSPQRQSVDSFTYARVNPLLSPATSSLSSGEVCHYIGSNTSSSTVPTGTLSLSQELSLQGQQLLPQSPHPFAMVSQSPQFLPQSPLQPRTALFRPMRLLWNNRVAQQPKR